MKTKRNMMAAVMMMVLITVFAIPSNAATKKEMALQAYASLLQQSYIKGSMIRPMTDAKFSLIYLDNNKVPELLITAKDRFTNWKGLFTFSNGRVITLYDALVGADFDFKGYYKKTGIFYREYRHLGEMKTYYKLSKSKTKMVGTRGENMYSTIDTKEPDTYSWNNRKMSRSAFFNKLGQAIKHRKLLKPKYFKNTEENRLKVLGYN